MQSMPHPYMNEAHKAEEQLIGSNVGNRIVRSISMLQFIVSMSPDHTASAYAGSWGTGRPCCHAAMLHLPLQAMGSCMPCACLPYAPCLPHAPCLVRHVLRSVLCICVSQCTVHVSAPRGCTMHRPLFPPPRGCTMHRPFVSANAFLVHHPCLPHVAALCIAHVSPPAG